MEHLEPIWIIDADYLHDYVMVLTFSNGERKNVDFEPLLHGKRKDELRNRRNFVRFALNDWTLEWYNGVDFAPEALYERGVAVS